ncbi:MAG: hypothetical protein J5507_03950 [Clostridia bacterium]|nr:hypothetical protein [Clostridia bacterium]
MENNISDMLNKFKDVLSNSSTNASTSSSDVNNSNSNITPEMITNLVNNLKSNNFQDTTYKDNNSESTPSNQKNLNQNVESNSNLDIDTILKIKTIIEAFNQKNDTRANLLYSLKPYLRESRQKKVDQYVNFFKLSGITKLLKKEKGDLD